MDEYTFDLHRIIVGDLPLLFYVEISLRTAVLFTTAMLLIRTMGKRSLGQMSTFDFVIIIALGSAVGDPMFYDDVPLLYGMLVVTVVVMLERVMALLSSRRTSIEQFLDSTPTVLVRDGIVDIQALRSELMSRSELFQALRSSGVRDLQAVQLAVLEPSGHVSVRTRDGREGVSELWSLDPDQV